MVVRTISAYGFSAYDTGFLYRGKIYPNEAPNALQNYYGLSLFTPLNVNPFTAVPRDYATIMLQWTQPQGDILDFRLLSNRYGYPVDENDGNILIDSSSFPGSSYADQDVIPGAYHYYGIYLLTEGVWNRAGLTSCLMPFYYATGTRMYSLLPPYFTELTDPELTQDQAGNQYLAQYLNVIGWSMDYLQTQYDMLRNHLNDPMAIPLGDLMNLAGELGMPFQPEIPASLARKAVASWTHVCQERGTPGGIAENVTLLTGYPLDLRSGRNIMLENDQAVPVAPTPTAWSPCLGYQPEATGKGARPADTVTYGNYIYQCTASGGLGTAPTGTTGSNTYWQCTQNTTDPNATLANPGTVGGISTWEAIYPALDDDGGYTPTAGTLVNTIGLPDPVNTSSWRHGCFSVFNKQATDQDIHCRSVSRIASDMTGDNIWMAPDNLQVIEDGLPIPWVSNQLNAWVSSVRYPTDSIVIYDSVMYLALRASTGAVPPSPGAPLNQNFAFETGVTPWANQDLATIAQSSTEAFQGTYSLKVTPNGTASGPGATSEMIDVIPNALYVASAWVYAASAWSTGGQVTVTWYDAFGQFISVSSPTAVALSATTWTQVTLNATAPGNAAAGQLTVQLAGTPGSGVVSYWDDVSLSCAQTPEWAVLSPDSRLRLMTSGYTAQALTVSGNHTVQVVPYVEWYDGAGAIITSNSQSKVIARAATPGTPGICTNLTYDSFTLGSGTYLNGRQADTQDQSWVTQAGLWSVSAFGGGTVYPAAAGTRSMATVTGLSGTSGAPLWLGVTFVSSPEGGQDAGIVFRAASTSSYWRAGMSGLYSVTGGASTLVGSYSTACSPGDRLTVYLAGNAITVYRNGAQVLTATSSFNATQTGHGLVVENTGV